MQTEKSVEIIRLSDIALQKVEWLWYPYIPFGKVTIVQGDPGEGKTRLMEIDTVVAAMYEDKALGRIPDHRFQMMTEKYNAETERLQGEIEEIEQHFKAVDEQEINTEMFIDIIKQYKDIRKLTPQIVSDLIEKIVVGERQKVNGKWEQQFDIYYRFVGLI